MIIKIIALAILTEALVELFFKAAPLQQPRRSFIRWTPFLRSEEQGHLLECKYCTSLWIAAVVVLLAYFTDCQALWIAAAILGVARASNYAHLIYGWIRDSQINKRLERK